MEPCISNLRELCILKEEHLGGVGLAKRSKRRTKLGADAEQRILLEFFRISHLGCYNSGRRSSDSDSAFKSDYAGGVESYHTFLGRHIPRMEHMRDIRSKHPATPVHENSSQSKTTISASDVSLDFGSDDIDEDGSDDIDTGDGPLFFQTVHCGEIESYEVDPQEDAHTVISRVTSSYDNDELNEEVDGADLSNCMDIEDHDGFDTDDDLSWG